jgi:hypothetical protein
LKGNPSRTYWRIYPSQTNYLLMAASARTLWRTYRRLGPSQTYDKFKKKNHLSHITWVVMFHFSYHSKSTPPPLHYIWHKLSSLSSQTFSLSKFTPPLPPNPHHHDRFIFWSSLQLPQAQPQHVCFRSMFLDLFFYDSSTIFVFFSFLNQTSIVNFFLLDWNISSSCFVFLRFTISLTTLIKQQS